MGQVAPGEHDLLRALRDEHGLDLAGLAPTKTGESGAAFWITDRDGLVSLLKLLPGRASAGLGWWHELAGTLGRLRDRGYPAPRLLKIGQLGGRPFWIQEQMAGTVLAPAGQSEGALIARLLPELLRLNDAQEGLGTGDRLAWRELIATTLAEGGDGYCVHATLAGRADGRDLLQAVRRIGSACAATLPAGRDFVHFDFNLANLLSDGTAITGVVDIDPPTLAGDRAFDVATLLFYLYDLDAIRGRLWTRLLELAGRDTARAYLAHMVLRQVDWSLRFHPAAATTTQHSTCGWPGGSWRTSPSYGSRPDGPASAAAPPSPDARK